MEKNLILAKIVLPLVASLGIGLYSLPANADDKCSLGQKCALHAMMPVYIPINSADGTNFKCVINAVPKHSIQVLVKDKGDFVFPTQFISVHPNTDTEVTISGNYRKTPGSGEIRFTKTALHRGGSFTCVKQM